ncbi:transmembrane protein 72 isoform X1 [Chiloscyllium plagiosum]|uniref:transmembrane protein 72 isoform X1 n=1 Tax=Chiloscyllium plagiosum TaxID=36176 RepID=UPI001CB87BE8|nr:transmembrane protein 72 isoform X1 [Chiloscyllium plagiosum]
MRYTMSSGVGAGRQRMNWERPSKWRKLNIILQWVLLGVGIDTAVQGQFMKLAAYLLFAATVLIILESPYFIGIVFVQNCPIFFDKMDSKIWNLWKKAMRPNGLQKFLIFIFLSVACFLHPILIWHATIPGAMLIVSGLAYFFLNLRKRYQRNMPEVANIQVCSQDYINAVALTDAGQMEQTYRFHHGTAEKKLAGISYMCNIFRFNSKRPLSNESVRTLQESTFGNLSIHLKNKHAPFLESSVKIIPPEPNSLEEHELESEETTFDKAAIIPK